ncbi:MAG: hypothetical protein JNL09_07510 [Anaerolineales bacterium]|nr:hypothetical protein [Anaerolineales bacterium]
MDEKMVRTQVYLTRTIYNKLQARAEKYGLTMAIQIREALEDYVQRLDPHALDVPIFDPTGLNLVLATLTGGGPADLAENHDAYLYGEPIATTPIPAPTALFSKTPKAKLAVREKRNLYAPTRKRKPKKA